MELIPILSTIILVATIMTFILAVGAYILYKIREKRGFQTAQPQPSQIAAELVAPVEMHETYITGQQPAPQPIFMEPQPVTGYGQPLYYQPQQTYKPRFSSDQKTFKKEPIRYQAQGISTKTTGERPEKFLKYTSEGYIPTSEEKTSGELKWR